MNLNIIYSILSRLIESYEEGEIAEDVSQLSEYMSQIAGNPANSASVQESYNELHIKVFMKLHGLDTNNFSSFELEYLKQTPYEFLLPGNLKSKILSAERGKSLTPAASMKAYKDLEEALEEKFESASNLVKSLDEIGAESYIEAGEAFLALIMTSEQFDSELKVFHTDLKTFEQGLTFLIQGSSADRAPPKIHALSNLTPITVVSVSIAIILAVAKVLEKALDIAIKKKEFDKLNAEIKILDVEVATSVNDLLEKVRKSEVEKLVSELADGDGDANENKTKIRKGVERLFSLIEKGHTIDFVVSEPEDLEDGVEVLGDKLSFDQFKDIRKISFELKKIQKEDVSRLLLEAPETPAQGTEDE